MKISRAPMRWRFFAAGTGAVLLATGLGAVADRALVLAELPPPLRYLATTAIILVLLVGPLLWSLERWVVRPLEALEALHTRKAPDADEEQSLKAPDLPTEMAEVIHHHTKLLDTLRRTNDRLRTQVERRTSALEAIVGTATALHTLGPGVSKGEAVLPHIAGLDHTSSAAFVHRTDGRWEAIILPRAPPAPDAIDELSDRIRKTLGRGQRLRIRWLPPIDPSATPVRYFRVMARQPLRPDPGRNDPAALALLSMRDGRAAVPEDAERVLSTVAAWLDPGTT